jgi:hypothetical protein
VDFDGGQISSDAGLIIVDPEICTAEEGYYR